jgi:hypothetical protein
LTFFPFSVSHHDKTRTQELSEDAKGNQRDRPVEAAGPLGRDVSARICSSGLRHFVRDITFVVHAQLIIDQAH